MNKDELDQQLDDLMKNRLTREAIEARMQHEKRDAAFRGALFVAALVAAATLMLVGAFSGSLLIGAGVALLVFVATLVYLFGVALGEW